MNILLLKNREKIWARAGPEYSTDEGKIIIVVRAPYGLRSSGAAFRALFAEVLYGIGYKPTKADPDVYLRPDIKSNEFQYYKYVVYYVDDVLCISENPMITIQGIEHKFELKDDKIEPPEI